MHCFHYKLLPAYSLHLGLILMGKLYNKYSKQLIFLLLPCWIWISIFSCRDDVSMTNKDSYSDFRFRKIQIYIEDSTHYFRAIDSVYADLPYFRKKFETYNTRRDYYYTFKKDYEKALLYSDSILLLLNDNNNVKGFPLWYPQALALKADDLHKLKRYSEAFTYYYLAREAIYQVSDTCLYSAYSNKLGLISYQHKQYRDAADYFKQAVEQQSYCTTGDNDNNAHVMFANRQNYLDNIGLCYSRLNMHDSALFYFDSALRFIDNNFQYAFRYDAKGKKNSDTNFVQSAKGVIYGNMAVDLMATGNDSAAERLLQRSITINSAPYRAIEDVPYSQAKLAGLYIRQLQLDKAHLVLSDLKSGLDSLPNLEIQSRWYLLQSSYLSAAGNYAVSNEYLRRYTQMNDSINAVEYNKLAFDLNQTFRYLKSQSDLYAFNLDNARSKRYLLWSGVTIFFVMLIALLLWYNYRQSKKHVRELAILNKQLMYKQEHLEKAFTALQMSQEENARMMKIVAHDLRNPISSIKGMSDFLLSDAKYSEMQYKMLEMIQRSSTHSIELIQNLAQADVWTGNLQLEPVDISALVKYCIEMLELKAAEKSQSLFFHSQSVWVMTDREKIWRVFSNLIGNAIKFSASGKEIVIEITAEEKFAIIAVKDKGIGIPVTLQAKIFHADPVVKRKGTSGEESFGLGLAICKQIVEKNDGELWFETEEGVGSVFFVKLPLTSNVL